MPRTPVTRPSSDSDERDLHEWPESSSVVTRLRDVARAVHFAPLAEPANSLMRRQWTHRMPLCSLTVLCYSTNSSTRESNSDLG